MARTGRTWRWALARGGLVTIAFCGALIAALVLAFPTGGDAGVRSTPATGPRVVFIGDSWTEGAGATGWKGFASLTGERLGWTSEVLGVGGSGYVSPGVGRSTFGQRIDPALDFGPDVVVVQGSINEYQTALPVLATAARRTLGELRERADEHTRILVLGASYVPGMDDAVVAGINRTVGAAAAQVGLRFVNPATENWSDPDDPTIWADPRHLNDRGSRQVADHLVPLLRELVRHPGDRPGPEG